MEQVLSLGPWIHFQSRPKKINMRDSEDKKGLGDVVESLIKTTLPKIAAAKAGCISCKKRKIWLNNFGAIFS
jgi:hypothetical protein